MLCLVLLIGQPKEALGTSSEDALAQLTEEHEIAWEAMKVVFKALWPDEENVPGGMSELVERLKGARRCILTWNILDCWEGRERRGQWSNPLYGCQDRVQCRSMPSWCRREGGADFPDL